MKKNNTCGLIRILASVLLVLVFGTFIFTCGGVSTFAALPSPDVSINNISFTTQTETINYSYKVEESYQISSFPNYYNLNMSYGNEAEAAASAANLMAYYGKTYSNLVSFTPGSSNGSYYLFSEMIVNSSQKQALIDSLYDHLDLSSSMIAASDLRRKMTSYANSKGYMLGYYSVLADGVIDYSKIKRSTDNGYPTMLYLNGSNYVTALDSGTSMRLRKKSFSGYHMCLVYGYKKIDFYNESDEMISSKLILNVSFGNNDSNLIQNNSLLADDLVIYAAETYIAWEE